MKRKSTHFRNLALVSALTLPTFVAAQADWEGWSEMREQVVSAQQVLEGDVSNGINPIGTVRDLVLSSDGDRVEYVMMEVPYPYTFYGGEDGFVAFDQVELQPGAGFDIGVIVDRNESVDVPQQLELTGAEAESRLVSRLINERLYFEDETSRAIQDMLIDRETGAVTHWIVEMDEGAPFSTDRRAIPVEQISIEEGSASAQVALAAVDDMQTYDVEFL